MEMSEVEFCPRASCNGRLLNHSQPGISPALKLCRVRWTASKAGPTHPINAPFPIVKGCGVVAVLEAESDIDERSGLAEMKIACLGGCAWQI